MTFWDLTEKDLADWRDSAVSKLFLSWWESWIAEGKNMVVVLASRGEGVKAAAVAGRVQALEELLTAVSVTRNALPTTVEEFFVDPAMRPRRENVQKQ